MKTLLYLTFAISLLAYRENYAPPEKEVKDFFAQMDDGDLLKHRFLLIDSIVHDNRDYSSVVSFRMDTFTTLTKEDITLIANEMAAPQADVWTTKYFDSAIIVPQKYIDSIAESIYMDTLPIGDRRVPTHYSFSLPWFSKDHTYCLLSYDIYCGRLCAEISYRLYKKINGRWVHIESYDEMVS